MRLGKPAAMAADGLLGFVRRHDPDRFLTALFAPPARRDTLLARTPSITSLRAPAK